jgi:PKD repeat protein
MFSIDFQHPKFEWTPVRWASRARFFLGVSLVLSLIGGKPLSAPGEVVERRAMDTLAAVEMNHGDLLEFTLADGQTRTMRLLDTWARVVLTNLPDTQSTRIWGGSIYAFGCDVVVDGQPMTMIRYVPVQESFYEPYVINGMRVWFDGVKKIGDHFLENHGACLPKKDARFAIQDATLPICSEELRPWYANPDNFIDVERCYNGDDTWMGPYGGFGLHGGLDIDHPIGSPLWAPLAVDDHYYFNSIEMGHNNNRWRAIRHWDNGQRWVLQTHHLAKLLVAEHTPIERGQKYAAAAGELPGTYAHTHFVFKVGLEDDEIGLDPWILFWQIFENNKRRAGDIKSQFAPISPMQAGEAVAFDASGSRASPTGGPLEYRWTFGDGGCSTVPRPTHVFAKAGVYPVTLTISDATRRDAFTQHITVKGEPVDKPVLAIASRHEPEFAVRPVPVMDVYGTEPHFLPHTLRFLARPGSTPRPPSKTLEIRNLGDGELGQATYEVEYHDLEGWLRIDRRGEGNEQMLEISASAYQKKDRDGVYRALVHVACPGAHNSPQTFEVRMWTPRNKPVSSVVVDNEDEGCVLSPYYWLTPRIRTSVWRKGENKSYAVAADVPGIRGTAIYRPDLRAGRYRVSFGDQAPIRPTPQTPAKLALNVTVRHRLGIDAIRAVPTESREIGIFEFEEGADGFVRLETEGAEGAVVADSVAFERIGELESNEVQHQ